MCDIKRVADVSTCHDSAKTRLYCLLTTLHICISVNVSAFSARVEFSIFV